MKNKSGAPTKSPLEQFDLAVREGDATRAGALLAEHRELASRINEPRFDFDSPAIHQAKNNLPLVDVLLAHGADIEARSTWWAGGFGILESRLTIEEARPLIERGAPVTAWAAAGLGMLEELKAIVGAAPETVRERGGDGKTVLHCALTPAIVEFLIDSGANLEARDTDHNATPLQHLIGDEAIARLLIARGAKVDVFAPRGFGDVVLSKRACATTRPVRNTDQSPPFTAPAPHLLWTLGFDPRPPTWLAHSGTARPFSCSGRLRRHQVPRCLWHTTGSAPELAGRPATCRLETQDASLPSSARCGIGRRRCGSCSSSASIRMCTERTNPLRSIVRHFTATPTSLQPC